MRRLDASDPGFAAAFDALVDDRRESASDVSTDVAAIVARVKAEGDAALAELLDEYPEADRQQLRTLVRNALSEKAKNKPPRAFREIYHLLRELFFDAGAPAEAGDASDAAGADDDGLLD